MQYFLAIDIGASSGRHILGSVQDGKLVLEEIYRFSNGPKTVEIGGRKCLQWDYERLFGEIVNGLKRAGELGKIPYSVGIDTWGVDYALLDEKDEEIGGVYCYRDARTERTVDKVHEILPLDKLYQKTGIAFATFNTVYQLFDDVQTRMPSAKRMLNLPDYFHFRLTGVKKQEYTMATTTGMLNAKTHGWDSEILDKLGYKREIFGEISMPGQVIGEFTDEIAQRVGYKAKVILPATHDTASAVLAAPLDGESPYISSGTWSLLGVEQENAHTNSAALEAGYSNEGGGAGGFRLQMNIMGLWMIQQVRAELAAKGQEYSFAELADLARANAYEVELDVNDSAFLAPESMISAIENKVGKPLSVGQTAYVIFDNLAKCYARALTALEGVTGKTYDTLTIIGGGSKNVLLNELTAKYTHKKIVTGVTEGTAIGNLMMQMIGAGTLASVQEGRALIKNTFAMQTL